MRISFERPLALLLFIPLAILIFFLSGKMRSKSKTKKNKYTAVRMFILLLLVLAFSGISLNRVRDRVSTVFLVDVSDSMTSNMSDMERFLEKQISSMPEKNEMGIVAFGSDSKVEQFMTDKKIFTGLETTPQKTATNIESAIASAMSLYPEGSAKRLVLISDGIENEGSMLNMAGSLEAQGIELDVLKLDTEKSDEVYVDDLKVPETIRIGDKYAVTVSVISNVETDAEIRLFSGRTLKGSENVKLSVGENQYVFYDEADETGFRNYRVEVIASKDSISLNNEYSAYAQVESKDKVLVIEGAAGESEEFTKALDAGGVDYDKITPTGVPRTLNDMMEYKSIIIENVHIDDLKKEFLDNLESYVKDYAGGILFIGGDNAFALGGWRDSVLEKLSPVNVDLEGERSIPKMSMCMVIDHSGSMMATSKDATNVTALDLAKNAAIKALDNLRDTDEVSVLAFDDSYTWVQEPTLASDRDKVSEAIGRIEIRGGTSIYPALNEAYKKMKESDAAIKHIILLTDGEDTFQEFDAITNGIKDDGITLSTVAVGESSDTGLMQRLANACGGRYYYTDINNGLPRIFAKEVFLATKEYLINEEFTPAITADSPMIGGLKDGSPSLLGYIATTKKPTATSVLVSHKDDPILATWQYGLGKTVAWTTDVTGEWSGNFSGWEGYPGFLRNVIDYTISDTEVGSDQVEVSGKGSTAHISYSTKDYDANTKVEAVATDENGNKQTFTLDAKTPGQFETDIKLSELGIYNIAIVNKSGDKVVRNLNTATAFQYSAEYRFYDSAENMDKLVTLVGGKELTVDDTVFKPINVKTKVQANISDWLLMLALILIMIDIIERRLNVELFAPVAKKVNAVVKKVDLKKPEKKSKKIKEGASKIAEEPIKVETIVSEKVKEKTDISPKNAEQKKETKKKAKEQPKKTGLDTNALLKKKQERDGL
ncbi:MAG: VWA domain-containing protein [Lachnospiraceae bacterium]|nr:VWA domain-containing protein [Lachnospiraceae bacterium]